MTGRPAESLLSLVGTWLALLALLAATWASAYLRLGPWNTVINLAIALAKAFLVLYVFMHLRRASGGERIVALSPAWWLVVLIGLTLSDVLSR